MTNFRSFLVLFVIFLFLLNANARNADRNDDRFSDSGQPEDTEFVIAANAMSFTSKNDHSKYKSRGYLTTPSELQEIRSKAIEGIEPYKSSVEHAIAFAKGLWQWEAPSGRITCLASKSPAYLMKGNTLIYAKALAYHLQENEQYAHQVMERITDLLQITSFGEPGNSLKPDRQCQLNLSWAIPGFIRAADLLENLHAWQESDLKYEFQNWLAEIIYPTISFTAETSMSNWGAAATNACTYIADYLWDRPDLALVSYNRFDARKRTTARTPAEAYRHAIELALGRMNGMRSEASGGSSRACDNDPMTKSMIRPDGGIPDELRRGSTGCSGDRILEDDHSNMYSQTHLEGLIAQAELLLRRGDKSLYDNIRNDNLVYDFESPEGNDYQVVLPRGRGSLKKAVLFILDNPSFQKPRALRSAAEVVHRYYRHPAMLKAVLRKRPTSGGRPLGFETLTHAFAEGENPGLPPTVSPPRDPGHHDYSADESPEGDLR